MEEFLGSIFWIAVICMLFLLKVPNSGEIIGYVSTVEKQGYFTQTWRVYIKTDLESSESTKFCVTDEALIPLLQTAQQTGGKISLKYSNDLYVPVSTCNIGDKSIVTDFTYDNSY